MDAMDRNDPDHALPATLFVRRDDDGDDSYFIADETAEAVIDEDGPTVIGTYVLDETRTLKRVLSVEEV